MSLTKMLLPDGLKFTPSSNINWTRIETLIHGPGADDVIKRSGGDANSAVFACLMSICTSVPEPPLKVYRREPDGKETELENHPLRRLLDMPTPNSELDQEEMLFWTAWALHTHGNAYWFKTRAGDETSGNVVELWPVSPTLVAPRTLDDSDEWIDYYRYQIKTNEFVRVPVENVIHFRNGVDDRDMRLGLSPLKRLVRQISTDEEADKFTESLLKNYAVPGLVVIPAAGGTIDKDTADRISNSFSRKFGNENKGNTAVLSREATIHPFGFSPEELNLSVLHRIPEERIAAVMGVPAIIAGLGAGLERSTYSNFREAREMFTESKLVPLWRSIAGKLDASLKPDFANDQRDVFVSFDLTSVRALQEDEDRKYARLNIGVQGMRPWITVNEARTEVGLPPIEGGDELTPASPFSPFGGRSEDNRSGDEESVDGESVTITPADKANGRGGADGQRYPFPDRMALRWEGYP